MYDPSGLGTDNSGDLSKWGHGSQSFAQSIPDTDLWLRWEASTSEHSRIIHFDSPVLGDFLVSSDTNNNFLDISSYYLPLDDHTALLPGAARGSFPNGDDDQKLTSSPFFRPGNQYWTIKRNGKWEVDNKNVFFS